MKRREFLKKGTQTSLGFGIGLTILSGKSVADTSANNKINIALIGCGGRGTSLLHGFDYGNNTHIAGFQEFDDVNVAYCCDLRKERGEKALAKVTEKNNANAKYVSDMQTVLDDKSVDAVVNALPDHWHALGAILAIQAGKDVYTEKPASQSGWEGQKMVEAARKHKRIVQHGTQNRSAPYNIAAKKYIDEGKLGTIHLCRVFNQKHEMNSFKIKTGEPVPEGLNWSAWLGPAEDRPYSSTILNSNWHELWDFSSGDVLNDGVHQIDLARWLIGKEIPKSAYAVGGRFTDPNSDAQTPDTLIASYEFDNLTFTVEETLYTNYILKIDGTVRQSDMFPYWMQCATRIELYGTKGLMIIGRHGGGWQVFDRPKDRQPVVKAQEFGRFPDVEHKRNFLDCIRSRELPNADIEKGHRSTSLVHYSTISYRLGGVKLDIDETTGVPKNSEAAQYWKRDYRAPYVVPEEV
ncbi:MAG: Gfo/Idh/MocA family oxidoreductase [Planctomycetaceae bacterium]|jgi:predicted dehydrogenase|nr:Gfo/Idh/MocA family oxidoreductase [Planctomycetaceae bacterium]